jgi:ABC-type Fe3+-hydroxamate transport system substrate-binding protein
MIKEIGSRDLAWIAPFLCVGFIALGLLRPNPTSPPLAHGRTVVDAEGIREKIEDPFRGIALTRGAWTVEGYLMNTRSTDSIMNAGGSVARHWFDVRGWMSKVYPQVLRDDKYWNVRFGDDIQRTKGEIETLYEFNPGAFLGNGGQFGMVPFLRRAGLPILSLCWYPADKDWDDCSYSAARVETSLLGHPEAGEALIDRYKQAFADIKEELNPDYS